MLGQFAFNKQVWQGGKHAYGIYRSERQKIQWMFHLDFQYLAVAAASLMVAGVSFHVKSNSNQSPHPESQREAEGERSRP